MYASRRESTREERVESFSRQHCKARAVVWRGKDLLGVYETRSELRLGGRRKKGESNKWDENKQLLLGQGIVHWTALSYVLKVTVPVGYSAPHIIVMGSLRKIKCCPLL